MGDKGRLPAQTAEYGIIDSYPDGSYVRVFRVEKAGAYLTSDMRSLDAVRLELAAETGATCASLNLTGDQLRKFLVGTEREYRWPDGGFVADMLEGRYVTVLFSNFERACGIGGVLTGPVAEIDD